MQMNKPDGLKLKMRERKLTSGVNWQGSLKLKRVQKNGVKQGLGVVPC
jgi:hypothetical protein